MNKEEIEKEDRELKISIPLLTQEEINGIDINMNEMIDQFTKMVIKEKDLIIAQYIIKRQQEKIEKLEQKESILDKVTDYIKMYIDDKQNEYEAISESYICQTDEDEYIKEKKLAVIKGQKQVLKNVLNIIEGDDIK